MEGLLNVKQSQLAHVLNSAVIKLWFVFSQRDLTLDHSFI